MAIGYSGEVIRLVFSLSYLNTVTTKYLVTVLNKIKELEINKNEIKVMWDYFDDDILWIGEELSAVTDLKFTYISSN